MSYLWVIPKLALVLPRTEHESDVLDAYIIEEIKKQEEERRRDEAARPRLRIEIPHEAPEHESPETKDEEEEEQQRGPIRIDL